MKIMLTSPHGSSLMVEFSTAGMSPDGVDMRLRQLVDTYDGLLRADIETGCAIPSAAETQPEITTELDPDE